MQVYIFLFYSYSQGVPTWVPISKHFRHCDYIMFDGESCAYATFGRRGVGIGRSWITTREDIINIIHNLEYLSSYVVINRTHEYIKPWFPVQLRTCNEMCRIMTGLELPFTLTPYSLYKKLLKYDGKRNYKILKSWSVMDGD